ncbi:hypothetical protein ES705_10755 [subsurface metagenome]
MLYTVHQEKKNGLFSLKDQSGFHLRYGKTGFTLVQMTVMCIVLMQKTGNWFGNTVPGQKTKRYLEMGK